MALTPTQEAQVLELINQQAALLSLAGNEATITSKLAATKVNLGQLTPATVLADADLFLVRQGVTDKSAAVSVLKTGLLADNSVTTAKIANDAVTFAKIQNIATARVLGRSTAGSGDTEELTLGSNLTLAAGVLNAVDGVPAGAVAMLARNTAPTGWLKANGALVSRTTYATLFAAIGTTFGVGDGSTTFGLPDLRGEFLRGWDDGRGVDSGRVFGSAQSDALQGHIHAAGRSSALDVGGASYGGGAFSQGSANTGVPISDGTNGTPRTASETRPRNVALLCCIKF